MTYVQPSVPIHASCSLPAGTSMRAPGPNVSRTSESSGYATTKVPRKIKWVVRPLCEWGG